MLALNGVATLLALLVVVSFELVEALAAALVTLAAVAVVSPLPAV